MTGLFPRKTDQYLRIYVPKRFLHECFNDDYAGRELCIVVVDAGVLDYMNLIVINEEGLNRYIEEFKKFNNSGDSQQPGEPLLTRTCTIDNRGRITIPKLFARLSLLNRQADVYCVGVGGYFEIWNYNIWNLLDEVLEEDNLAEQFKDLTEELF